MTGEIDVQDRDDAPSGARFIIRLPAAELRMNRAAPVVRDGPRQHRRASTAARC